MDLCLPTCFPNDRPIWTAHAVRRGKRSLTVASRLEVLDWLQRWESHVGAGSVWRQPLGARLGVGARACRERAPS